MSENNSIGNQVSANIPRNSLNENQLSDLLILFYYQLRRDYERLGRDYNRVRTENNIFQRENEALKRRIDMFQGTINRLSQQNQELTEENGKLKSEQEIRQEKLSTIVPVPMTQFSIFDTIDEIKQSTGTKIIPNHKMINRKRKRPKCETDNDNNKNLDKNNG